MTKSTGKKRFARHGLSIQERFDYYTPDRPEEGCWLWTGPVLGTGYGQLSTGGRGNQKTYTAHRLAYLLNVGEIPEGLEIEHVCEVKLCVRWSEDSELGGPHIRAVTHFENMARSQHRIGWAEYWRRRRA